MLRTVILSNLTMIQNQDLVIVDDGVETVSDGDDSAVSELCLNDVLDQLISLNINTCTHFIQQQNPAPEITSLVLQDWIISDINFLFQQSSSQTNQLFLSNREVITISIN